MSSLYTIDQLKRFSDLLEQDGFNPQEFNKLGEEGRLRAVLGVIRGTHEIRPIEHAFDLAIPCRLPFNGAERVSPAKSGVVKLEKRGDDLYLNGKRIELWLSDRQKNGGRVVGHELRIEREKLGGNLSAKILDYLEEHPELWPESWKKDAGGNTIYIYFWDDIFRYPASDSLYVRYGYWCGGRVVSDSHWLDSDWPRRNPAASLA